MRFAGSSISRSICAARRATSISGVFGGAVANPAMVLAQVLAQMKDRGGPNQDSRLLRRRASAGGRGAGGVEEAAVQRAEVPPRSRSAEAGGRIRATRVLERVWARPTFEVNGLLSGFTGEGAKTVIPAVAMAKVSMRLVPDQDPDRVAALFETYLRKVAPKTVELTITRMHGGRPWITGYDNEFVRAAGRAIEQGFGKAPVFCREGGSIPVVSTFTGRAGAAGRAVRRRTCPTRTRTRRTSGSISRIFRTASSRRRCCTTRSPNCDSSNRPRSAEP